MNSLNSLNLLIFKYHDDPTERADTESAFGLPPSGWDGVSVLTFDSADAAKAVFSDPDFKAFAAADSPRFSAHPNVTQKFVLLGKPEVVHRA